MWGNDGLASSTAARRLRLAHPDVGLHAVNQRRAHHSYSNCTALLHFTLALKILPLTHSPKCTSLCARTKRSLSTHSANTCLATDQSAPIVNQISSSNPIHSLQRIADRRRKKKKKKRKKNPPRLRNHPKQAHWAASSKRIRRAPCALARFRAGIHGMRETRVRT